MKVLGEGGCVIYLTPYVTLQKVFRIPFLKPDSKQVSTVKNCLVVSFGAL